MAKAAPLGTPRLVRYTRRFTGILPVRVPTGVQKCVGFACLRGKIEKSLQQEGIPKGPSEDPPLAFVRPSICDQAGSKEELRDAPRASSPPFGRSILPLLCWVRGARGPAPPHSSRFPPGSLSHKRGRAFFPQFPCVEVCLSLSSMPKHCMCDASCPCSLRSERLSAFVHVLGII